MPRAKMVNRSRRRLLRATIAGATGAAFAGSWLLSRPVYAQWPKAAFEQKTSEAALRVLFGDAPIESSDRIAVELPALAENGAVVPITVTANLSAVESISILSEKNPVPLIARFDFGPGATGGYLATRIKLAESVNVAIVVKAGGRLYSAQRHVRVIQGGCD